MYGSASYLPAMAQYPHFADDEDEYGLKKKPILRGPAITPAPQSQIRSTPASLPSAETDQRPVASRQGPPSIALPDRLSNPTPMDMSRKGVPLPSLPGETGGPHDWSDVEQDRYDKMQGFLRKQPGAGATDQVGRAEFEHMVGGLKRDKNGRIQPEYKRDWKTLGLNLLKGFLQGAAGNAQHPLAAGLGGLATAGITSAISPKAAREYDFETGKRPELEHEIQRQRQLQQTGYEDKKRDLDLRGEEANIEGTQARTAATRAGMKDSDMIRRKQEADIALVEARTQAMRTGKPTYREIENSDGSISTVQVFPDGSMMEIGKSGKAAMGERQITSREEIADKNRLSRENTTKATIQSREKMGQAGIQSREGIAAENRASREKVVSQNQRLGGGPLSGQAKKFSVSREAVAAYAREKGISPAEAEKQFRAKGFDIK